MFGQLSERSARYIRRILALAWVILIISLFWDPVSMALTRPENTYSPFRLNRFANAESPEQYVCPTSVTDAETGESWVDWGDYPEGVCDPRCSQVQGRCIVERPYAMGASLFWSVVLPIVPLFLMVFGHEAWRRICPLSFFAQIPRRLGIQRQSKSINPRTGRMQHKIVLVGHESWLERNFWFVQFGFLFAGVSARILFINSDRMALGFFFTGIIILSMIIGYLYGGKTWCNYICPLSPVQKIYSEPRGIFESQAHINKKPITQSMCRTIDENGQERTICVGCKSNCPDIDLERGYWQELEKPGRRFVYYGYFGLVLGFYLYYALYAGNLHYYFSGAWTHEEDQLQQLFSPGFYLFGQAIAIPKLIAAPLTIGLFILAAYALGCLLEAAYDSYRQRVGKPLSREQLLHQTFSVSSFATINAFYLFGGRPNLNLLPPFPLGVFDAAIFLLSGFWLWRTIGRSSTDYKNEGLVDTLRRQLKKLKVDFTQLLEGRSLEELSAHETYLLAKTLPHFGQEQKQDIYKQTLREAIESGYTDSAHSLALMNDLRQQMELSEDEHAHIMLELGIEDSSLLDSDQKWAQENQRRLSSYGHAIESMLRTWIKEGTSIRQALEKAEVIKQIEHLQALYQITSEEQEEVLAAMAQQESHILKQDIEAVKLLQNLAQEEAAISALKSSERSAVEILQQAISEKRKIIAHRFLNVLQIMDYTPDSAALAYALATLAPHEVDDLLWLDGEGAEHQWLTYLPAELIKILREKPSDFSLTGQQFVPVIKPQEVMQAIPSAVEVLHRYLYSNQAIVRATALYLLAELQPPVAGKEAQAMLNDESRHHWLVLELCQSLLKLSPAQEISQEGRADYRLEAHTSLKKLLWLFESRFFNHLPLRNLTNLARHVEVRLYNKGTPICREGEEATHLFLLHRGIADVVMQGRTQEKKVATLLAGETFGELALVSPVKRPHSATVLAAEEQTIVLAISDKHLKKLLSQSTEIAMSFLRLLSQRLLKSNRKFIESE